jgi:hypothetical protein
MPHYRTKAAAQDAILDAIIAAAQAQPDADVKSAMLSEAARIARKWGVKGFQPDSQQPAAPAEGVA